MNRYIPISISDLENLNLIPQLKHQNATLIPPSSNEIIYNITIQQTQNNVNYAYLMLYIAIIAFSFLMIYIVLLYLKLRISGSTLHININRDKDLNLNILQYNYSYEGLAKILREVFLSIRDKLCGKHCTPRETALTCISNNVLKLFADVYEDVVYGLKMRTDVVDIITEVKNYFSKD